MVAFDNYFIATNDIGGIWKIIDAKSQPKLAADIAYQQAMSYLPKDETAEKSYLSSANLGQLLEKIISPLNLVTKIGKVPPPEVLDQQSQAILENIKPGLNILDAAAASYQVEDGLGVYNIVVTKK